tara:strand:+ start:238 stop:492 length:255 start_codon:yes stop_codon:yes gene_type:complete
MTNTKTISRVQNRFKINIFECLRKDDEMNQHIANSEDEKLNIFRCAQNTEQKDFLISLGWRFDGIEKLGRKDVYRMNKMFNKIN